MKKRILALVCLFLLCAVLLSGCRCEPSEVTWLVQSFQKQEVFVNGVEHLSLHTGTPSVRDPFGGMETEFVSITFSGDGAVTFQPGTGEVLTGTYSYQHNGIKETHIAVTLENGESFYGTARSNSYVSTLTFTFRDLDYLFQDYGGEPQEYYTQGLKDLCAAIRYWSTETIGDIPINPCTISVVNEKLVLSAKNQEEAVVLDQSVGVRCYRLDGENNLHSLDEIMPGDCYYTIEANGDLSVVTLYYLDPPTGNK